MFAKLKADGLHKKNMGLGGGLMGKSLMAAAKLDEGYSPTKPAGMSMLRAAKTVGKDQTASLARAVTVRDATVIYCVSSPGRLPFFRRRVTSTSQKVSYQGASTSTPSSTAKAER